MGLLSRGKRGARRGRRTAALVTAGALMAFQALALVMAPAASAAVGCSFSGGVLTLNSDPGDFLEVAQDSASGTIKWWDAGIVDWAECTPVAPIATTTAIAYNGDTGDESAAIAMFDVDDPTAAVDWGTVNFTINLGSDATDDDLFIDGVDFGPVADDLDVVFGASGIDLNNDADLDVTIAGIELFEVDTGDGDDSVSAAGSTATGAAFASDILIDGGDGDDTLTGGAGNDDIFGGAGDDTIAGGLGDDLLDGDEGGETDGDTVDFSGSATAVNANLDTGNATGQGLDTLTDDENLTGSPQGDTLTGDALQDNWITGGAGDDKIDGKAGSDTSDYSDSAAAVTVDLNAGTATGNGNDTLTSIENAQGSDFADTLTGDDAEDNGLWGGSGNDTLAGGGNADDGGDGDDLEGEGGVDTVDYGAYADPVALSLNCSGNPGTGDTGDDIDVIDTMENAILTTDDDTFFGNGFANTVWPNGGQNSVNGDGDPVVCGAVPAAAGGDLLDYSVGYDTGVEVNMAGGAVAGDSAVGFENAKGTEFADSFTGNDSSNTLKGGKGADNIRGGAGDDTLGGAGGSDVIRAGSGDDDLKGGAGNDYLNGGSGDDFCKSGKGKDEVVKCEAGH